MGLMIPALIAALAISGASPACATEWLLYNRDQNRCEIGRGALQSPGGWADGLRAQGRTSKTDTLRDTVFSLEHLNSDGESLGREISETTPEAMMRDFSGLSQTVILSATVQADDTGEYHEWMQAQWCAWFGGQKARERQELH